jgi:hypothetical protein
VESTQSRSHSTHWSTLKTMNWPIPTIKNHLRMSLSAGSSACRGSANSPRQFENGQCGTYRHMRKNQTYALFAKAKCFVFSLAYCECDILSGNSVSATFSYPALAPDAAKQNICDLNAQGAGNGYMASTFSLPPSALKGGNMAVYTCPASSAGAYAQCDGGICFNRPAATPSPASPNRLRKRKLFVPAQSRRQAPQKILSDIKSLAPIPASKKFFNSADQRQTN